MKFKYGSIIKLYEELPNYELYVRHDNVIDLWLDSSVNPHLIMFNRIFVADIFCEDI